MINNKVYGEMRGTDDLKKDSNKEVLKDDSKIKQDKQKNHTQEIERRK